MAEGAVIIRRIIFITTVAILAITLIFSAGGCRKEPVGTQETDNKEIAEEEETLKETDNETENGGSNGLADENYKILYHLSKHNLFSYDYGDIKCFSLNFYKFMDGGIINFDGSDNQILDLREYPTSLLTSKKYNDYYYIYSPDNPVIEMSGFEIFNWDLPNQTIIKADYDNNNEEEFVSFTQEYFPGDITTSPDNKSIIYVMTAGVDSDLNLITPKMDPFINDSILSVKDIAGKEKILLDNNYNRQLFTSFSDFSNSGNYFFTISKEENSFNFVRIALDTGEILDFSEVFKYVDWSRVRWNEFFPKSNDFSYASFSMSPDEERLVAYKNYYSSDLDNPCYTKSTHSVWLFNLENGDIDIYEDQKGYVSDISWEPDGQKFAMSIMTNCGCYPDYLSARIDIFDKNAKKDDTVVDEPKSKITNLGWSPDGKSIAYDVYGMDFIGKLKLVNIDYKSVNELISTEDILNSIDTEKPVLILFSDWVVE